MRLSAALLSLLALVLGFAADAAIAGDDPLTSYRRRYTKDAFLSDREDLVKALGAVGTGAAREAIAWCVGKSDEFIAAAQKESDKHALRLKPLQEEFDALLAAYVEAELKAGRPYPKSGPVWPVTAKLNSVRADLLEAEKKVIAERALRETAIDSHGACVDRLPAADQEAFRADLAKGPLKAKDWGARAALFEMLRSARAEWVTKLLLDAAAGEPDPRALVPALDALAGRDPAAVVPALVARLSDARWLVRAAALGALERSPSREGIDAIVERAAKEDGRLRDDCLRILEALTGADVARAPEAWKQWWTAHREEWKGPPAEAKKPRTPEEIAAAASRDKAGNKTGFFGIQTSSKRLCYVIDLSGSMLEPAVDGKKETRAETAKAELIRSIRGLEDGATFAMVMFAADVRVWTKDMTEANEETRKAAVAWIEASPVVGATNTYGALEAAFQIGEPLKQKPTDPYADPKLDAIILLSDGKPTNGRTTSTDEIRAAVREWNKRRRVTVHAIAFGKDADFEFLKALAADTGGEFRSL